MIYAEGLTRTEKEAKENFKLKTRKEKTMKMVGKV